jgi:hypothetical protein
MLTSASTGAVLAPGEPAVLGAPPVQPAATTPDLSALRSLLEHKRIKVDTPARACLGTHIRSYCTHAGFSGPRLRPARCGDTGARLLGRPRPPGARQAPHPQRADGHQARPRGRRERRVRRRAGADPSRLGERQQRGPDTHAITHFGARFSHSATSRLHVCKYLAGQSCCPTCTGR